MFLLRKDMHMVSCRDSSGGWGISPTMEWPFGDLVLSIVEVFNTVSVRRDSTVYYWASEASPTLGCSIEISCDIYIYVCVCHGPKSVGGITWAKRVHAQSQ